MSHPHRAGARARAVAVLGVVVLAAGCGSGDDSAASSTSTVATPTSTTSTTAAPTSTTARPAGTGTDAEVTSQVLEGAGEDHEFTLAYPQVAGTPADEEINLALEAEAQTIVEGFVEGLPELGATFEGQPHTLQGDVEVHLLDRHLASFRFVTSTFPSGAAHPVAVVTTHTYEVATGERVDLDAVFAEGAPWPEALSEATRRELRAELGDDALDDWLTRGTAPDPANFSAFTVTENGLAVTFQAYQVGPYAIGTPMVTIPFDELAPVVDPAGPLAPYVE